MKLVAGSIHEKQLALVDFVYLLLPTVLYFYFSSILVYCELLLYPNAPLQQPLPSAFNELLLRAKPGCKVHFIPDQKV